MAQNSRRWSHSTCVPSDAAESRGHNHAGRERQRPTYTRAKATLTIRRGRAHFLFHNLLNSATWGCHTPPHTSCIRLHVHPSRFHTPYIHTHTCIYHTHTPLPSVALPTPREALGTRSPSTSRGNSELSLQLSLHRRRHSSFHQDGPRRTKPLESSLPQPHNSLHTSIDRPLSPSTRRSVIITLKRCRLSLPAAP